MVVAHKVAALLREARSPRVIKLFHNYAAGFHSSPLNVPPRDFLDRWIHIFVSSFCLLLGSSPSGTPLRPRERETVAQCSRSSRLREKTVANALEDEKTETDAVFR